MQLYCSDSSFWGSAQVVRPSLYNYLHGQESYQGGEKEFYKDFHQLLLHKKFKLCDNKNELYLLKVIVSEDGSVNI